MFNSFNFLNIYKNYNCTDKTEKEKIEKGK